MATQMPIISFKDFSFKYHQMSTPTLKNINLDIFPGEKVLIAGPSGSGKSTLAHCINGLIPFLYEGEIKGQCLINGKDSKSQSVFKISETVGTVLQDQDAQFIGLTVAEDVAFIMENQMIEPEEMQRKVLGALNIVEMGELLEQSPHDLSGGQKQRVSLAGLLTTDAKVLLFDEPLANLDPASGKKTMALINELNQDEGKTVIIIEHRIEDVLEQEIDKIVVVNNGEIVAVGTPRELLLTNVLKNNGLREPLYVEALKYASTHLKNGEIENLSKLDVAPYEKDVNQWFNQYQPKVKKAHPTELLKVDHIHFSYENNREILHDVSFTIHEGEILSLVGNNGAGKSTLSNVITGILMPSQGSILFKGEDITSTSINERAKMIGYVMQNPNQMITQTSVKEEVMLGLRQEQLDPNEMEAKVNAVLKVCGIYPFRNWPIQALSYGQKKRVSIASILVMNPSIIILDEPTAGQDHDHYVEFMDFIAELSKKGLAFILITHDMHLALEYSSRAVVLSRGKVLDDDLIEHVMINEAVIEKANLKPTSLSLLAKKVGISEVTDFIRCFINYEHKDGDSSE